MLVKKEKFNYMIKHLRFLSAFLEEFRFSKISSINPSFGQEDRKILVLVSDVKRSHLLHLPHTFQSFKFNIMKNSLTFKFIRTFMVFFLYSMIWNQSHAQFKVAKTESKVELSNNDSHVREIFDETKANQTNVDAMTSMFKLDKGNDISILWAEICEERSEEINKLIVETNYDYAIVLREFLDGQIEKSYIDDLIKDSGINTENLGIESSVSTKEQPQGQEDRDKNSFETSGHSGITPYIPNNSRSEEFLKTYPNEGNYHSPSDPNSVELIEMRDSHSKYFQNADGSMTLSRSVMEPRHFMQDGNWLTYDKNVVIENSQFKLKQTDKIISISSVDGSVNIELENAHSIQFLNESKKYYTSNSGEQMNVESINDISASIENNIVVFEDFYSGGVSKNFMLDINSIRYDYILNNPISAPNGAEYLTFSEKIQLPQGWTIQQGEGMSSGNGWQGTLFIKDSQGKTQLIISPADIYDGNKDVNDSFITGVYNWSNENNIYTIELSVPVSWLVAPERIFPVIVDPTWTSSALSYSSSNYGSFSTSCDYDYSSTGWTGEEITGHSSTYDILATGGAWMSEQRSRINGNATQFGSGNSAGTYSYSVGPYTDLNGPATGSLLGTFQCYRTWGGSGCVTTYQNMSNWIWSITYTSGGPADGDDCSVAIDFFLVKHKKRIKAFLNHSYGCLPINNKGDVFW